MSDPYDDAWGKLRALREGRKKRKEEPRRGPKCFGYARVSLVRQAREGYSLAAQKANVEKYAGTKGIDPVEWYVDGGTSSKVILAQREAGGMLVERVRPGDHVAIALLDRAFRNLRDFLFYFDDWTERGVTLHMLDFFGVELDGRTAMGRFLVHVAAAAAEFERGRCSERICTAVAEMKAQGLLTNGKAPLGFKAVRTSRGNSKAKIAVPDPEARAIMGQILGWYEKGALLKTIERHLRDNNVPPIGRIKQWTWTYLYRVIKAERALQDAEKGASPPVPTDEIST